MDARPNVHTVYSMDWLTVGVQWTHVLLGILWFGNALALDVIVIPALNRLPIITQREISTHIGARATPIFKVVVPAIIVLGIVRGTVFGPIDKVEDVLGTAYGLTWLAALTLTVGVYMWGLRILEPALHQMAVAKTLLADLQNHLGSIRAMQQAGELDSLALAATSQTLAGEASLLAHAR